ncbi:MAG: M56 family metallopeptidase [Planctomycetota bacterium]
MAAAWLEALGAAVLGGALTVVLAALFAHRRRHGPARQRHLIWLAAACAHVVLLLPRPAGLPRWSLPIGPVAVASSPLAVRAAERAVTTGHGRPASRGVAARERSPGRVAPPRQPGAAFDPTWLLVPWSLGALLFAWRALRAELALRRAATRGAPAGAPWCTAVRHAADALAVSRPIGVVSSAAVSAPAVCGVLRPTVLVPASAVSWPDERIRMVAMHEVAHVARRDPVGHLGLRAITAVFWFDPVLRWAAARARVAAELAADERVVDTGVRPSDYVLHLVAVIRSLPVATPAGGAASAAPSMSGAGELAHRCRALLRGRATECAHVPATLVAAVLVIAGVAVLTPARGAAAEGADAEGADAEGAGAVVADAASRAAPFWWGTPAAPATGCEYAGGRHRDRWFDADDGVTLRELFWQGAQDTVHVIGSGGLWFAATGGGALVCRTRRAWLRVTVTGPGPRLDYEARYSDGRLDAALRVDGVLADAHATSRWLAAMGREVDLHTAFRAPHRVPRLLARDGVTAVLRVAAACQGGHAAGIVLAELLRRRRPWTVADVVPVLECAAAHVRSDAVMVQVLGRAAATGTLTEPRARRAFRLAAARLRSQAAREQAAALLARA